LDQMDMKMIELRKNIKKEKTYRDLTFGWINNINKL
jgi:hypothetical protein